MKRFSYFLGIALILSLAQPLATLAAGVGSIGVTSVERINLRENGTEPPAADGGACCQSDLSHDGNIATFDTNQKLVGADLDTFKDIYVHNRQTDSIVRASLPFSGNSPNDNSYEPRISGDGRYVTFYSYASNLTATDPNGGDPDVFVYDVLTNSVTRIEADPVGPGVYAVVPAISGNGRYVAYRHYTTRPAQGFAEYVTRYDRQTQTLTVFEKAYSIDSVHVADNGCVFFISYSGLVAGDQSGASDVYAVGCPGINPGASDSPVLLTSGFFGGLASSDSYQIHGTPDGKFLTFYSYASNLVPDDTNSQPDIFVYDVDEDEFSRASVGSNGQQSQFSSFNPRISADGRFVTWYSDANDLDLDFDQNSTSDIFVRDRVTGQTRRVSKQPATDSNSYSYNPAISGDGRAVVYYSNATNLVANDNNGVIDYFVSTVRVPANSPAHGDLDGDDKSDLVWRNPSTGANWISLMDGYDIRQSVPFTSVSSVWQIQGRGDFNGDKKSDLFWRNSSTGQNAIWLMNGTQLANNDFTVTITDPAWQVGGIGDFDNDGMDDLFWRNSSTGQNAIWLMNGFAIKTSKLLNNIPLDWAIQGVGDFDADGKDDLMWRRSNGDNAIWLIDGLNLKDNALLPAVNTQWTLAGVADMNGDGCADLVWRNGTTGQNIVWLMETFTIGSAPSMFNVGGSAWKMALIADFDGDERADIYWRNDSTGQVSTWLMDGATRLDVGGGGFSNLQYILVD